jgi:dihydrofolate synthase/folylpolyglutamate synthase
MTTRNSSHYQDFTNLDQWLYYLENLHSSEIDMGLSRISQVAKRLALDISFAKVITVAGTNGKGTTCAFIENALLSDFVGHSKKNVAVYSSPHIDHFNERLRINKINIADQPLIEAFKQIEIARQDTSLTYYEYTTLAAFLVLMSEKPDVIILEVGLGGRLDATNIIDADIAVITTVDLDHQSFLGDNREAIGFEKAGIMRQNQDIVIGDSTPPESVLAHAVNLGAEQNSQLSLRDREFTINVADANHSVWQWQSKSLILKNLIAPSIPLDNVATALMVLSKLKLPLSTLFVNHVIKNTQVAGRTELIAQMKQCDVVLDVGHNPQATRYLSSYIKRMKAEFNYQKIYAVVAMLADKDITASLSSLTDDIDYWYTGPLAESRAASSQQMYNSLINITDTVNCFDNINEAFKMASKQAKKNDLILVFGSFFTVSQIRRELIKV